MTAEESRHENRSRAPFRVLLIGGYGLFGAKLAQRLVSAHLPLVGLLAEYRGHLDIESETAP